MSVITLRLADDLKQRLQAMAESRGESLNHFIESIAVQALVAEETARRIRLRRERGSMEKALAVLDRVPDRPQRRSERVDETPSERSPQRRGRVSRNDVRRTGKSGRAA
jgi:predicted transcriptional regulator